MSVRLERRDVSGVYDGLIRLNADWLAEMEDPEELQKDLVRREDGQLEIHLSVPESR